MNDIEPITLDMIRKSKGTERTKLLRNYHKWLNQERKRTRNEVMAKKSRIERFKKRQGDNNEKSKQ